MVDPYRKYHGNKGYLRGNGSGSSLRGHRNGNGRGNYTSGYGGSNNGYFDGDGQANSPNEGIEDNVGRATPLYSNKSIIGVFPTELVKLANSPSWLSSSHRDNFTPSLIIGYLNYRKKSLNLQVSVAKRIVLESVRRILPNVIRDSQLPELEGLASLCCSVNNVEEAEIHISDYLERNNLLESTDNAVYAAMICLSTCSFFEDPNNYGTPVISLNNIVLLPTHYSDAIEDLELACEIWLEAADSF